jgi:DNA invertase Pin-like site-specific DNA recombinase
MNTNKSTAQAERIILALLEHFTEEKAAVTLGMSTSTIRRWLKRPEFQELYRKARLDAFSHVTGRAQYMAPSAAATLTSIANDPTASPAAQFRAAEALLKHANTFQLEELKARMESMKTLREEEMEETENDNSYVAPQGNSVLSYEDETSPKKTGASAAKMDRICLAVLQHGSTSKAAVACGVSPVTVWRWSRKPEFQEQCRKARCEKYFFAISFLQRTANAAMSTMIRLMSGKNVMIRIRAAEFILELARTGVQEDLLAGVDDLEKAEAAQNEENENEENENEDS